MNIQVYIENTTIPSIVRRLKESGKYFLVSANVVNSPALSWRHYSMGLYEPFWPVSSTTTSLIVVIRVDGSRRSLALIHVTDATLIQGTRARTRQQLRILAPLHTPLISGTTQRTRRLFPRWQLSGTVPRPSLATRPLDPGWSSIQYFLDSSRNSDVQCKRARHV